MADVLGAFEQAVLLAIVRLRDGAYGRAILKEVQLRLKRDVAAGAVHATLERRFAPDERVAIIDCCHPAFARSTTRELSPIRSGTDCGGL